jgi:CHAD domain-containing protein
MPLNSRELSRRLRQLRKSLKGFPKDPTVEVVHNLRTRARRVEYILEALELDSSGNEKHVLDHLKSIRALGGKVRDRDVFTSYVVRLGMDKDPDCVIRLLHHLGVQRHRYAVKLHTLVQRDAKELRRRLRRSQSKVESLVQRFAKTTADLARQPSPDEEAPLRAVSVALRLSKELAAVTHLGPKNLHAYRIEVKHLRSILEMAGEETGEQRKLIAELKRVQDAIGEWHDWLELSGIAHEVLRHGKNSGVVKEIGTMTHSKYNEALRITEQLRQRYLRGMETGGKGGKRGASRGMTGFSAPVLAATAEMVS